MNDRRLITVWYRRARQHFCSHRFYNDDLKRINDDLVRCPCLKCGKVCEATYGLALDGSFVGYRPKDDLPANRHLCFDCGAPLVAGDDDAMVCVQCGWRNRRVVYRVNENPPPPMGARPLPPPGPPLREGLELRLTKELRPSARPTSGPPSPLPWRNPSGPPGGAQQEQSESAGDAVPPAPGQPLTAEEVRKIMREEIERAMGAAGKSGRTGEG